MADREKLAAASEGWKHGRRWFGVDPFHPELLPASPGVYAVYINGELAYIGQSKNLRARLKSHGIRWSVRWGRLGVRTRWTPWTPGDTVGVKVRISETFGD